MRKTTLFACIITCSITTLICLGITAWLKTNHQVVEAERRRVYITQDKYTYQRTKETRSLSERYIGKFPNN